MTTTCLLCPAHAVADGLCVEDGARLWAAEERLDGLPRDAWMRENQAPSFFVEPSRARALQAIPDKHIARTFLDKLEAARKAREAAPLCSRGCVSHDEPEDACKTG